MVICLVVLTRGGCSTADVLHDEVTPAVDAGVVQATQEVIEIWPGLEWQVADTPEQLGWSSVKLDRAFKYAEKIGSAAIMIVEDGVVVDTWGDIERSYRGHSMRKSLLSALFGIYIDEGAIDPTATLDELGIDDKKPLTKDEKQATVSDLLKSCSGVYIRAAGESDSMKSDRPERGSHPPGTFWYYNNWDFNALGTIFDQLSGEENIYQALKKRIADPIGMQDYKPKSRYHYESYSIHPYYDFRMSTRDLARFGLLFLREGRWMDEQIIPADWVHESTATQSVRDEDSGYGYMWWTGEGSGVFPYVFIDDHVYWAWGHNAHLVMIIPNRNLVIVHREDTLNKKSNIMISSSLHRSIDLSAIPAKIRSIGSAALHLVSPVIYPGVVASLEGGKGCVWDIAAAHAINLSVGHSFEFINGENVVYSDLVEGGQIGQLLLAGPRQKVDELRKLVKRL